MGGWRWGRDVWVAEIEGPPMMGQKTVEPELYINFSLEAAVPPDHLLRQLDWFSSITRRCSAEFKTI
jgi:hypothetical protein